MGKSSSFFIFSLILISISLFSFAEACTEEGHFRCFGADEIQQCQNLVWVHAANCGSPQLPVCKIFDNGTTYACVCANGFQRCVADYPDSYETCDSNGVWSPPASCVNGICQQTTPTTITCQGQSVCNNGDKKCMPDIDSSTYEICANGAWGSPTSCIGTCVQTTSTTITCQATVCASGEDKCDSNKIYVCNSLGTGWDFQEDCGTSTCVLDSSTKIATCVAATTCVANTEQRCNANQVETCNSAGNGWTLTQNCDPTTETCVYNSAAKTASCQTKTSCVPDMFRCDSDTSFSKCNAAGDTWVPAGNCPASTKCTLENGGLSVSCPSIGPAPACSDGDRRCVSGYPDSYQTCNNGSWGSPVSCLNGSCVQSTPTTITCQPGAATCTNGDRKCSGASAYQCSQGSWALLFTCPSGSCIQSGTNLACSSSSNPGGGKSPGGNNGGGQTTRCLNFTDWYVKGAKDYVERASDGRTRDCTNTTQIRWCYRASGEIDYGVSQTQPKIDCGNWSGQCAYAYLRSTQYTNKSGNNCQTCTDEIYALKCGSSLQPGAAQKKQTTCTAWKACNVTQLTGNGAGQGVPVSSELDTITSSYGAIIGIILVLLVLVVAYTGWKMFTAKPE